VEPEFFSCGEVRQFRKWIDGAGVLVCGISNHTEWAQTFRAIIGNRCAQALDDNRKLLSLSSFAHLVWQKSDARAAHVPPRNAF